jgi:Arc/MetJ-type ribon-helix-helix transcriptional regulator
MGMKVRVSLSAEDVEFLDGYARTHGYESRSAVVHRAVCLLRTADLGTSYVDAWREWSESGADGTWDPALKEGWTG